MLELNCIGNSAILAKALVIYVIYEDTIILSGCLHMKSNSEGLSLKI